MATLVVIAGPTASGKSSLALALAEKLDADIINGDARQMVRGMNIGTAKPSVEDRQRIKHHFIDTLQPDEHYNAGKFEEDVIRFTDQYFSKKSVAILVGGSGLYLKAVIEGFDNLPATTAEVRAKWNEVLQREGLGALQTALKERDPAYAAIVDMHNPQRIQRALESMDTNGKPFAEQRVGRAAVRDFKTVKILLAPPRPQLYDQINHRVDRMMTDGLLNEVMALLPFRHCNALKSVGYTELFEYLDGRCDLTTAVEKIKQHTRNYAKRQMTWFKKQDGFLHIEQALPDVIMKHLRGQSLV